MPAPSARAATVALLLVACTDPGGSDTDSAATHAGSEGDFTPAITALAPDWDTTAGGAQVTLRGTFREDAGVRVGGTEAALRSVDPASGTLVFYAPPADLPGTVSVVLDSGGGSAALPDAFTYYADGTGLVGLIGSLTWETQVGGYWGVQPFDAGRVSLMPVEPVAFSWPHVYAPAEDTCVSTTTYTYAPRLPVRDPGAGSSVQLTHPDPLDVPWRPTALAFVAEDLDPTQLPADAAWDLGGFSLHEPAWPDYAVTGLAATPAAFTVTSPAIAGDTLPLVPATFALEWTTDSPADAVFVTLHLYTADQTAYQETVTCWLADDGAYDLSAGVWSTGWASGRQLDLFVSRVILGAATISFDHSEAAVLGESQLYGAAWTK